MKQELKNSGHLLLTALLRVLIFRDYRSHLICTWLNGWICVLGEGHNPFDIFSKEVWDKIFNFIN